MRYYVSRQNYYYSRQLIVEVAAGGRDYSGPDMLCEKYQNLGEGREYDDPREAVEAAIAIAHAWRKDKPGRRVSVAYGSSMSMGIEFEPSTVEMARKWAKETYEKLPKCDQCGALLPKEYYTDEFGELKFCREYCAEKNAEEAANFDCAD